MRIRFLLYFVLILFAIPAFSQTATVTIYYTGAQSRGCCNVCGTDYMCIGSSGCGCCQASQQTKTFTNPVPAGNIVTAIRVTYYAADCSAANVPTSINGTLVCTAVNTGAHTCSCGSCNACTCYTTFPCGFPGYNYSGINTLYANPQPFGTEICTQRVVIQFTYQPSSSGAPPQPGPISGPTTICPGQSYTYSISAVTGATSYNWTVPAGTTITSGQGTTSITVTAGSTGGNICVTASNSCGTSAQTCLAVSIAPPPAQPGSITGQLSVCAGQSYTYSISPVSGATSYTWTVPAGTTITSGQGTTSITITAGATSGNLCVSASNGCGTSPLECTAISVIAPPAAPGPITGTLAVCPGQTFTYSVNPVPGATSYTWTVPSGSTINSGQGTTSISVTFGSTTGNICVTASNTCGTSSPTCITLNIAPPPSAPGPVTGTTAVCPGQTFTYSISPVSGATSYTWTVPGGATINSGQGTTSITVTFGATGGNICVTASNTCGTSTATCITITISPPPAAPGPITGPLTVCAGSTQLYSISAVTGATNYNWTIPGGSTLNSGAGTTSVSVIFGLTSGQICVNASNACGTSTYTCINVTVNPIPVVSVTPASPSICAGGSIQLVASGATSYSWSPANGLSSTSIYNPVATPLTTTTYTVTGTSSGCAGTATVTVTVHPLPTASAGPNGGVGVCASSFYTLAGSGTGNAPLGYSWSPAQGLSNSGIATPTAHPSSTTTYTLTVTDMYGCTATDSVTVTVNPLPTASAGNDATIGICPTSNAILNGSGTGSGPLSYSWTPVNGLNNPNVANPTAHPMSTTTYTLTVTDIYGCTATDAVVITVSPMPTANAGSDDTIGTCATSVATLNGSGTGTAPLVFSWSPQAGLSNPNIATPTAHPASTTTYTLTVTDPYGCSASDAVIVTVDPLPTSNAGNDVTIGACSGSSTTLAGTGTGTGPLGYSWSPSSSLNNPNIPNPVATPGITTTYTLTVTDAFGCTATDAMVVTVNVSVTANAGNNVNIGTCSSSTTTLSGTGTGAGPLGYSWSPTNGLSNPNTPNPVAHPAVTTTYTLTVTDIYGCTATDDVTITLDPLPTANAGNAASIGTCLASTTTLNGTGTGTAPLGYSWSPSGGLSNPAISNPVAKPGSTTTYTLTVTDAYGCTSSDDVVITVDPLPVVSAGADTTIGACSTSVATLAGAAFGTGPFTYTWTPAAGLSNPAIPDPTAHPASTTTYTLTVSDTYGCTASDAVIVTISGLPVANAGNDVTIGTCSTSTTTLSGTAVGASPFTWQWTPAGGLNNPNIANPVAHPATTTTYTLTVTDKFGCTGSDNITVTLAPLPTANAGPDGTIGSCASSSFTLTGSGTGSGISYNWSPVTGLSDPNIANPVAHPAVTTNYSLVIIDMYGCMAVDAATVTVIPLPVISVSPVNPAICTGGSVALTASGGLGYTWAPGTGLSATIGVSVNATPASTTTYTVTGTDQFGCTASAGVTVTVNPNPVVTITPASPAICINSSTALTAAGATSYSWSPATGLSAVTGSQVTASPLSTITYTVTGTLGQCTSASTVTVTVNPLPVVNFPVMPDVCVNAAAFALNTATPAGGIYSGTGVSGGSFNPAVAGAGSYILTYSYTDGNGCTNSATQNITVIALPVITVTPANPNICIGGNGMLTASGASTYSWSPASGLSSTTGSTVTCSPLAPVTYTVTGTLNGCTASTTVTVNTTSGLQVIALPANPSICPGTSVNLTASGGSTYTWVPATGLNTGIGSSVIATPAATTTYTIMGMDAGGCTGTASVTVNVYPGGNLSFAAQPRKGCLPLAVEFEYIPGPDIMDSSWIWNFGDFQFSNNSSVDLNPTHIYTTSDVFPVTITALTIDGCVVTYTDTIEGFLTPVAEFEARPDITTTEAPKIDFIDASLYATGWKWRFGDPFTGPDNKSVLQNPFHVYSDTGTFSVVLIADHLGQCSDTVTHTVRVNEAFSFFIPNAFSPNDDGRNDVFLPVGIGSSTTDFEMIIYDRWGRMVFSTTNINEGWDGADNYSGNVCAQGIYTYIIKTREISGVRHRYIGLVTLII